MTEFETGAEVDISISDRALRDARGQIESELGGVTVDVEASPSASQQVSQGSGSNMAGKERAMSRSLLSDQLASQQTAADRLDDNLALNDERNDLLRELIDVNEQAARGGGGGDGFSLRRLGKLGGLIGGGGVALVGILGSSIASEMASVNWTQLIGNAIPDISPGDVVSQATPDFGSVDASTLIGGTVAASALIGSKMDASSLVTDSVAASSLVSLSTLVPAASMVAGTVGATDLVSLSTLVPAASLVTGTVAASKMVSTASGDLLSPSSLLALGTSALIPAGALVFGKTSIGQYITGAIDISNYVSSGESSPSDQPSSEPSGDSSPGAIGTAVGTVTALGAMGYQTGAGVLDYAAGSTDEWVGRRTGGDGSDTGRGPLYQGPDPLNARDKPLRAGAIGAGLTAAGAVAAAEPTPGGEIVLGSLLAGTGLMSASGSATGASTDSNSTAYQPSDRSNPDAGRRRAVTGTEVGRTPDTGTEERPVQVNYSPTYELDTRRLERELSQKGDQEIREIKRRIEDLERSLSQ